MHVPLKVPLLMLILQSQVLLAVAASSTPILLLLPTEKDTLETGKIEFKGNTAFGDGDLKEVMHSKETSSGFSQFLFRTFGEKLGSKPEYFDPITFDDDIKRLNIFYEERGFYKAQITGNCRIDTSNRTANLLVTIYEGYRSLVDSLVHQGLEDIPDDLRVEIFKDPQIQKGMVYEKKKASSEISRVLDILANNGYSAARFDADSSFAAQYTSSQNFFLKFVFVPGKRYEFGNAAVHVDPPREDITDNMALRYLDFQPGETYSREKRISSERNLNRLDIFESARVETSLPPDSAVQSGVPVDVFVRPRTRNEISPELGISDENNAFNLNFGIGYANRNFFGDARTFNAKVRVRTQSIQQWNFGEVFGGRGFRDPSVIGAVELQFQVLQPYLFTRKLSGSWTSSIGAEKQKPYILSILRNKMGLSNQFEAYTYGVLEWTLERVSPEITDTADRQVALSSLREEDQPQFNSILTLTLQRDRTNDIFSPTEGSFNSITLEESGILPKLLPGISAGLPFTQYYKVALFGRWYQDLTSTRYNILAWKLKTGYQDKYGESRSSDVKIPLNRRFFGGGSGSVRGWKARELGAMPDSLLQLGGNFILESTIEMRIHYFRGYGKLGWIRLDNIWGAYFLDLGNVWSDIANFKFREISIAAGIGIRYDTFFGPFRVDYGVRLYDPKETSGRKTLFGKKFFGETLGNGVLHFGIGQAF